MPDVTSKISLDYETLCRAIVFLLKTVAVQRKSASSNTPPQTKKQVTDGSGFQTKSRQNEAIFQENPEHNACHAETFSDPDYDTCKLKCSKTNIYLYFDKLGVKNYNKNETFDQFKKRAMKGFLEVTFEALISKLNAGDVSSKLLHLESNVLFFEYLSSLPETDHFNTKLFLFSVQIYTIFLKNLSNTEIMDNYQFCTLMMKSLNTFWRYCLEDYNFEIVHPKTKLAIDVLFQYTKELYFQILLSDSIKYSIADLAKATQNPYELWIFTGSDQFLIHHKTTKPERFITVYEEFCFNPEEFEIDPRFVISYSLYFISYFNELKISIKTKVGSTIQLHLDLENLLPDPSSSVSNKFSNELLLISSTIFSSSLTTSQKLRRHLADAKLELLVWRFGVEIWEGFESPCFASWFNEITCKLYFLNGGILFQPTKSRFSKNTKLSPWLGKLFQEKFSKFDNDYKLLEYNIHKANFCSFFCFEKPKKYVFNINFDSIMFSFFTFRMHFYYYYTPGSNKVFFKLLFYILDLCSYAPLLMENELAQELEHITSFSVEDLVQLTYTEVAKHIKFNLVNAEKENLINLISTKNTQNHIDNYKSNHRLLKKNIFKFYSCTFALNSFSWQSG